jgi:1,4-dihydroxy-2-naphthoyl-CoA hydrolase
MDDGDRLLLTSQGFDGLLGLELTEVSAEVARGRLAVRPDVCQPWGVLHGGVYAAIAESLASRGTSAGVMRGGSYALGLANHTSFLRPVGEGSVEAVARPLHRGRTTWVWDVQISDDAGRLCAVSRVTIAVKNPD